MLEILSGEVPLLVSVAVVSAELPTAVTPVPKDRVPVSAALGAGAIVVPL